MSFLSNAWNLLGKSSVFMIFNSRLNYVVSIYVQTVITIVFNQNMIWVLHSDLVPGNLGSDILRNNACKISHIRKQDVFVKHNAPDNANSNEGQDHIEKYFDTSRKILSQWNDYVQYGSSRILFLRSYDKYQFF